MGWKPRFWWQLGYDIALSCVLFTVKKGGLHIGMYQVPVPTGCHLTSQSKGEPRGKRAIKLQAILLLVLKTAKDPSGLGLLKKPSVVALNDKYPLACDIILNRSFLMSTSL